MSYLLYTQRESSPPPLFFLETVEKHQPPARRHRERERVRASSATGDDKGDLALQDSKNRRARVGAATAGLQGCSPPRRDARACASPHTCRMEQGGEEGRKMNQRERRRVGTKGAAEEKHADSAGLRTQYGTPFAGRHQVRRSRAMDGKKRNERRDKGAGEWTRAAPRAGRATWQTLMLDSPHSLRALAARRHDAPLGRSPSSGIEAISNSPSPPLIPTLHPETPLPPRHLSSSITNPTRGGSL